MANKRISLMLMILSLCISCEKRIPIDADFPYESNRLFCEIIGVPDLGFYGQINQIKAVQSSPPLTTNYQLTITEDGTTIIEVAGSLSNFFLPYNILAGKKYSLQLFYDTQLIESGQTTAPDKISINDLNASNDFIDSLGFNVVSYSFNARPTNASNPDQYYSHTAQLLQNISSPIDFFNIEEGAKLDHATTNHIQQRLPNISNKKNLKISIIALDKELYLYLKNIKKLGIIPNDDIAGHHGNLRGALGYFGIINYDLREVSF